MFGLTMALAVTALSAAVVMRDWLMAAVVGGVLVTIFGIGGVNGWLGDVVSLVGIAVSLSALWVRFHRPAKV